MARVPLDGSCIDIAVYCLVRARREIAGSSFALARLHFIPNLSRSPATHLQALMGTNFVDFLLEGHRVLKLGGILKIAEVRHIVWCTWLLRPKAMVQPRSPRLTPSPPPALSKKKGEEPLV
jgi:hypothetical protein